MTRTSREQDKRNQFQVRFGCGFLAGFPIVMLNIMEFFPFNWLWPTGLSLLGATIVGLLAAKLGDKFWFSILGGG